MNYAQIYYLFQEDRIIEYCINIFIQMKKGRQFLLTV